jgi:DNA primase catalytic core
MTNTDFRQAIDQIRSRTDIVDVIGNRIDLNRQNKALCPFHEEQTPSFSVNAKGQYFHCFGCGAGGDAIRFIELSERMSFMEALSVLAGQAGIELPQLDGAALETLKTQRSIEDVLTVTAHYYHRQLPSDAREYLTQARRFTEEMIERFLIGWSDGGLKEYLTGECDFPLDLCLEAGVLKKTDDNAVRDYFHKRIIFPNVRRGRVVHMTSRCMDGNEPKYLHLPGKIEYLFNEDDLRSEEVVLTEGVPDCLSAVQAGHKAVAMLGTSHFKESLRGRFDRCQRVYVCMDGDQSGHQAAVKVGRILADKAIIVNLPEGQDVNDYMNSHEDDEFRRLLDGGRRFLDVEIDRIGGLPENIREDELKTFLPLLRQLDEFEREKYTVVIAREFKLSKRTIKIGIDFVDQKADEVNPAPPEPSYTDDEERAALEILRDPNMIERLVGTVDRLGCVGEVNNKITVFLALTSRILDRPISLIVKGDSSGGKSRMVETVALLFPRTEILSFTALTRQALYYRKDSLAHKALIVFEREGAEESDYSIRSLQSEGKLVIGVTIKDPDTNEPTTVDKEVEGPIAYIETTTRTHLHDENETRCFGIYIDDSTEQTQLILEYQKKRYSSEKTLPLDCRPWQAAQMLLKSYPVRIPFVDLIKFPHKPLRVRRDHERFLSLIEVITVLHQYQRDVRTFDGVERIIATLEDYAIAYGLASTIMQQTVKAITPKAEKLVLEIAELQNRTGSQPLSRKEIAQSSDFSANTVKKYLSELLKQGVLDEDRSGRAYVYSIVKLPGEHTNLLLSPEELQRRFEEYERDQLTKPDQKAVGKSISKPDNGLRPPDQSDHDCGGAENAA